MCTARTTQHVQLIVLLCKLVDGHKHNLEYQGDNLNDEKKASTHLEETLKLLRAAIDYEEGKAEEAWKIRLSVIRQVRSEVEL